MKFYTLLSKIDFVSFFKKQTTRYFFLSILLCLFVNISFSQQGFGNGFWNVNVYDVRGASEDINTLPTNYVGYYTQKLDVSGNYGMNTDYSWVSSGGTTISPSNAVAFNNSNGEGTDYVKVNGTTTGEDFTFIHKRKGFPAGKYKIVIDFWDDETYVFIDGVFKNFSGSNLGDWSETAEGLLECVDLDGDTEIEIRTSSQQNPSNLGVSITSTTISSDAGSSATICSGETVNLDGSASTPNANYTWSGPSIISGANTLTPTVKPTADASYQLTVSLDECTVSSSNVLVDVTQVVGNPNVFGENKWNVYGYRGSNTNLSNNQYVGFYEQPALGVDNFGVNTQTYWSSSESPSSAGSSIGNGDLWNGCEIENDFHTFVHKRKGFPCNNYTFTFKNWDDETRLLIDGVDIWSCNEWSGSSSGTNSTNSTYNCGTTLSFTVALDTDSEVEFQTLERTGGSNLAVDILPAAYTSLSSSANRTCSVSGNDWVVFRSPTNGQVIAAINPNGNDLGKVTVESFVNAPAIMQACNTPHPSYHSAYLGRTWVMNSTAFPNGTDFNNEVTVKLPYTLSELSSLNDLAETSTLENPFDGGVVEPVTHKNIMLTKITGGNLDGQVNQMDCSGTIRGYNSVDNGPDMLSINNTEYVDFNIQQFSEFFLHKNNGGSALPVELTNFSVTCDEEIVINWTTASEKNSDKFIVEKSRDGVSWNQMAQVEAAGNSTVAINYSSIDFNKANGISYYRLRQIDFDGKEKVFGPISALCKDFKNNMVVYPNPNDGTFTLEISSNKNQAAVQLYLTDMTGKIILNKKVNLSTGINHIPISKIDLSKGAYMIVVQDANLELSPVKMIVE